MFTPMQGPQDDGPAGPPEAAKARASASIPTAQPHLKAGARLRAAREELGLSLKQISDDLRIKTDYLQALESMNVNLIPGKAFARAYLRDYAKRLGLPAQELMAQYENECARLREDADEQIRNPRSKPGRERPWLWAVALALVAAGFVGLRAMQDREGEEVATAPAPAPVTAEAPATLPPPTAEAGVDDPWARRVVELRATAPAWLEVRGSDGTIFASRTMQAGEVYRPDVGAGWTLHARDGGSFEVLVNGQPAGLLGDPGTPVLGRQVDRIEPPAQPLTQAAG
jgi:transcriptional regulator with XRE-family HTH domain